MILTIIAVALLLSAIVIVMLPDKLSNKFSDRLISFFTGYLVAAFILGGLGTIISVGTIIAVNVQADVDYQNKLYERQVLEYRIEHLDDNLTGNELIYNDVVTFNNSLRRTKKEADSPWLNWFTNQDIADLDYVELPSN